MAGGVAFFDRATGKRTEFATPEEATSAFQAGTHGPRLTDQVPVRDPDGKLVNVQGKDLAQALAAGASVAPESEVRKAQLEAKLGAPGSALGLSNQFIAQATGAARGATVGLSDAAIIEGLKAFSPKTSETVRQHLADVKEAYPVTSGVSAVGGATAAALAGGAAGAGAGAGRAGASGLARLLPAAGVDALGGAAESAVGRLVGQGATTALGRAVQSGAGMAARGALEGALYAAGDQVTEDELGDHQLTAEKLYTAAGRGALFGGLAGGALGTAGSLLKNGGASLAESLAPKLQEAASEQAWKSLSPLKKFSEQANARAGGTAAVGRTLLEEGVLNADAGLVKAGLHGTPDALLPAIQEARARVGARIGEITENSTAKITAGHLFDETQKIVEPLRKKAGFEGIVATLEDYTASLFDKLGATRPTAVGPALVRDTKLSVQAVIEQRKALDDLVYREVKSLDPKLRVEFLRDIRSKMENVAVDAIDQAAKAEGNAALKSELLTLKRKYQHLSIAEDAAETSVSRMATNRNLSLSDYAGAVGAVASGHPFAAPIVAVGHKVARERGNAVAAVALEKLAQIGALKRATVEVDAQLARSAEGMLASKPGARVVPKPQLKAAGRGAPEERESLDVRFRRAQDQVAAMQANPQGFADNLSRHAEQIGQHAPNVSAAYTQHVTGIADYLTAQMPQANVPPGTLSIGTRKPQFSDSEKAAFVRKFDAATDPKKVLADLEKGRVKRDELDVLRATSPKLFAELQQHALELASEREAEGKPLTFPELTRMSVNLGVAAHPAFTPQGIRSLQANFAPPPPAGGGGAPAPHRGGGGKGGGGLGTLGETSALDRIEAGKRR